MKLTPIDIANKTFNKKMLGVDEADVTEFLQQMASLVEELIHERNNLKEAVRDREIQLNDLKERDQILKQTITTAGQMAERMREDSEREAKLILADAQQKAEIITRDSRDSLKKMYQEIAELKRARLQFEANLKALAHAHITLLEQGEKYMPNIGLPNVGMDNSPAPGQRRSTDISPLSSGS